MLTALIDYDSGNLHSAAKAFERMADEVGGGDVIVTDGLADGATVLLAAPQPAIIGMPLAPVQTEARP